MSVDLTRFLPRAILLAYDLMLDVALHQEEEGYVRLPVAAKRMGSGRRDAEALGRVLVNAGILASVRGPSGGYRLAKPPDKITLLEIFTAVQGGLDLGNKYPPAWRKARVLSIFASLSAQIEKALGEMTLDEIITWLPGG